jgi:hypothetical protein
MRLERGIGRHRGNPEEREQPFETPIEIAVDAIEHRVELAHDFLRWLGAG